MNIVSFFQLDDTIEDILLRGSSSGDSIKWSFSSMDTKETDGTNAPASNKGLTIDQAMEGAEILETFQNPDYVGVNLSDLEVNV